MKKKSNLVRVMKRLRTATRSNLAKRSWNLRKSGIIERTRITMQSRLPGEETGLVYQALFRLFLRDSVIYKHFGLPSFKNNSLGRSWDPGYTVNDQGCPCR